MTRPLTEKKKTLRQEALEEIHGVKWIPAWGEDRMYEMIEKRPDWCVSRQRFWVLAHHRFSTARVCGKPPGGFQSAAQCREMV